MGAAGLDLQFEQRKFAVGRIETALNFVVSDRFSTAARARGHAGTVDKVSADGSCNRPFFLLGPAVDQGDVGLLDLPAGELGCELAMGKIVFGHDDETARVLVQPMDNARPRFATNTREGAESMQQGIDQSSAIAVFVSCA